MARKKRKASSGPGRRQHSQVPVAARRAANEASIRQFFGASDPAWRWVLLLGLRDLRQNASRLGELAESPHGEGWSEEPYVYGPLINGLTAAAVNECTQHCEDLFAVLRFLREEFLFAKRMLSYKAGTVTAFGLKLRDAQDSEIAKHFVVPSRALVERGLERAEDPDASTAIFDASVARLGDRVREIAEWYSIFEAFHVEYKHGLKLAMRPFGDPIPEAIEERKENVSGALIAFTAEPISKMLKGPEQQRAMTFPNLGPEVQAHLGDLVDEGAVLRYKMSGPEVDLDEVVRISGSIVQLLRIAGTNRMSVSSGLNEYRHYSFSLPGEARHETVEVSLELSEAPSLSDF